MKLVEEDTISLKKNIGRHNFGDLTGVSKCSGYVSHSAPKVVIGTDSPNNIVKLPLATFKGNW